jgi:hypothetical protein
MLDLILWRFRNKSDSDLRKALAEHLAKAPPDAPFQAALNSPEVQRHFVDFEWADWVALRRQRSFRRASRVAIWAGFIGAAVPALGLLLPLMIGPLSPTGSLVMDVLRILSIILTSFAVMWLSFRQSGARWFEARSRAEAARAKAFQAIIDVGQTNKSLLPQSLNCFRAAHLDRQQDYFATSRARHLAAANKIKGYRKLGYGLLIVSAVLGVIAVAHLVAALEFVFPVFSKWVAWLPIPSPERWNEGLNAMSSSILAFTSERTAMDRDTRNAAYYELAANNLGRVADAELQLVENAATRGDFDTVKAFCQRIQSILDAEHRIWATDQP